MVINLLSLQIRCGKNRSFPTSLSCWEASIVRRASSLKGVNCVAEEYNPKRHRKGCILWFCFFVCLFCFILFCFFKREHLKSYRVITLVIVHAQSLSGVQLFVILWTVTHQAPLSMEFSEQKYWSGLSLPTPGDLPHSGIQPASPASPALADSLPLHHLGSPNTGEQCPGKQQFSLSKVTDVVCVYYSISVYQSREMGHKLVKVNPLVRVGAKWKDNFCY